jgi:hypothetical protein
MSATIIPFPKRGKPFTCERSEKRGIVVQWDADDGWYVVRGSHGWIHSDVASAWADAQWLADNLAIPVRIVGDL